MIKKLRRLLKKFLANQEQVRIVSVFGLLLLITAIPLTVYVAQTQQDIRQHATGGGFSEIITNGCGEAVSTPADGQNEGDISWRAPVYENGQWVTHKQDGSTINQDTMRDKYISDSRNGGTQDSRAQEWDTNVVSANHINCNVFIIYHGIDCDRIPTSGFVDLTDSNGQAYKAVSQGGIAVLHVIGGNDPNSPNCRYEFNVRTDVTSPTISLSNTPTPTTVGTLSTPTATPTPTGTPVASATSTQTPTPSQTPTPTMTLTPTIPKTPTQFSIKMVIPGIGKNGNTNPNFATRDITFSLFDKNGKQVGSDVTGHLGFDGIVFSGTINMGTIVPSDTYIPWIQTRQGIKTAVVSTPLSITAGVTNELPQVTLISGDINADGKIDILDFNILSSCFGAKATTDSCGGKQVDADLNDDGVVDGIDYNLFLSGLKASQK
ncbi:MAG TPA: dockerin type I repeat-containing protein [Legionellaceae bacterium]|nr:dockerin type I repeat-containing protein [Legionellaceae bacterium]